jgi:hypothetical protein
MVGSEKTFQSTRSTLAVYLRALAMMPDARRDERPGGDIFSFRSWAGSDSDAWVFLPVPARARDAVRPLVSLFLDTAIRHVMSLRPDPERRIWLEIDELPSLQNIPSLSPALAEGRKYGISAILGAQTFHQIEKSFGKSQAQALWGLPKTRLYLRIADAETADMISRELGEIQLKRETTSSSSSSSHSTGGNGATRSTSSSTSTSEQVVTERLVLPSEIAGLPDLVGYLRTGGSHRVAKVKLTIDGLPRSGDQPDFVWIQQRPMPTAESVKTEAGTGQQQQETAATATAAATMDEVSKGGETMSDVIDEIDDGMSDAEYAEYQKRIATRAIELMNESFKEWDDYSLATLTAEEKVELREIFIQRAQIEIDRERKFAS